MLTQFEQTTSEKNVENGEALLQKVIAQEAFKKIKSCESLICHATNNAPLFLEWLNKNSPSIAEKLTIFSINLCLLINESDNPEQLTGELCIAIQHLTHNSYSPLKTFLEKHPDIAQYYHDNIDNAFYDISNAYNEELTQIYNASKKQRP